ncbi:flagellar biosynthetic protein FliR [Peptostreptococcaceae bacterium AGR-M142]
MNEFMRYITENVYFFMLIFLRVSSAITVSPLFGRKNLPNIFKLGLSLAISFLIYPFISVENLYNYSKDALLIIGIKEVFIGVFIGMIMDIIFNVALTAGSFMDVQIGFAMARVVDPNSGGRVSITGNFFNIISLLVFITINGHYEILKAIINSFRVFPLDRLIRLNSNYFYFVIELFDFIMNISIRIAIPIILALFLTNLVLGVMARTIPQMNVFVVGMPLKILVGVAILIIAMPFYLPIFREIYFKMIKYVFTFLNSV